jgi:hypothetical protein
MRRSTERSRMDGSGRRSVAHAARGFAFAATKLSLFPAVWNLGGRRCRPALASWAEILKLPTRKADRMGDACFFVAL